MVNYVYLRNPFADGRNDKTVSRMIKNPISRLHRGFKILQMNLFSQYKQKAIKCRRLETKRHSDRNGDFGFRRKAQVRSNYRFNLICPYHAKETPPGGRGTVKLTFHFYKVRTMQRRHLRREGGNQNPTKAGIPPSLLRFLHALKRQALIFSLPSHPH